MPKPYSMPLSSQQIKTRDIDIQHRQKSKKHIQSYFLLMIKIMIIQK